MPPLKEAVPYVKSDVVAQRLQKSAISTVSPGTFGVEFEYDPGPKTEDINPIDFEYQIVQSMTSGYNWKHNRDACIEWVQGKREYANRRYGSGVQREWDDQYGPVDLDTWDYHHEEPNEADFTGTNDFEEEDEQDFKRAWNEWNETRSDVNYEFKKWERSNEWESYADEWASDMVRDGEWQKYTDLDLSDLTETTSIENEIDDARGFIEEKIGDKVRGENGTKDDWGVGEDGEYVEIRSKHLTEAELPKIEKLLKEFLPHKKTGGDTSAHVHVGLPAKFDAFDIIAMSDLVDEDEIQNAIGKDRNYSAWAKLNYDLAGDIITAIGEHFKKSLELPAEHRVSEVIETGWLVKMNTLEKILKDKMRKYRGTNLASFWDHRTIEFRYWSSGAAVRHPQTFINWIRYFLLLPKVAYKRNRVVIGPGRQGALVCSRHGTNYVKIEFEDKFKEALLKNYQKRLADKHQIANTGDSPQDTLNNFVITPYTQRR